MKMGITNNRPRLRNRARLQRDPLTGKAVVLYQEGIIELNDSGCEILLLCDGTRSLSGIVQDLENNYPDAKSVLSQEVFGFLELISRKGLIEWI
jgi:pyrroloquinoline quinone biosynthesis protein D